MLDVEIFLPNAQESGICLIGAGCLISLEKDAKSHVESVVNIIY